MRAVVVDEWHELLGTKRGVQTELAISYLRFLIPKLKTIGISATLGNKELAGEILMGLGNNFKTITSKIKKRINVKSIIPKSMERFPWRGHLGTHLIDEVIKNIRKGMKALDADNVAIASDMDRFNSAQLLKGDVKIYDVTNIDQAVRNAPRNNLTREQQTLLSEQLAVARTLSPEEQQLAGLTPEGIDRTRKAIP